MNILGLTKTTLLDYPGRVAATIFIGGCNFRCPFCHNRDIVLQNNITPIPESEIVTFLTKRQNILQGICITGGEPTLNSDLPTFIAKLKDLGYDIKLDTNGTNPELVNTLIEYNLINYCAMDIKNSFEKYNITCGFPDSTGFNLDKIKNTISILMSQTKIDYEFRTTIVKELHTLQDITAIAQHITGANHYYLQPYKESPQVLTPGYSSHDSNTLITFAEICNHYVPTSLRGI